MSEDLTQTEMMELQKFLGTGSQSPDDKHNVHTFLHNVATAGDTTKTGFLKDEEVGLPKHPVRTEKKLALISEMIMGNPYFAEYFKRKAEIVTSTSLSKEAKLLSLAVVSRREVGDVTKKPMANKGWFKKKNKEEEM